MRDVVVNEIPDLFRPGGLYATASFAGALAFIVALDYIHYGQAMALAIFVILFLRLASVRLGLSIPRPHWVEPPDKGAPS
jgi:uncharacterized membrane protein YeiH